MAIEHTNRYIKPGEKVEVHGQNEMVAIVGEDDPDVMSFLQVYGDLRVLRSTAQRDGASEGLRRMIADQEQKVEKAWNELPDRIFRDLATRVSV
jgi:hypothetical protein